MQCPVMAVFEVLAEELVDLYKMPSETSVATWKVHRQCTLDKGHEELHETIDPSTGKPFQFQGDLPGKPDYARSWNNWNGRTW